MEAQVEARMALTRRRGLVTIRHDGALTAGDPARSQRRGKRPGDSDKGRRDQAISLSLSLSRVISLSLSLSLSRVTRPSGARFRPGSDASPPRRPKLQSSHPGRPGRIGPGPGRFRSAGAPGPPGAGAAAGVKLGRHDPSRAGGTGPAGDPARAYGGGWARAAAGRRSRPGAASVSETGRFRAGLR
jgi:hypothetical protein